MDITKDTLISELFHADDDLTHWMKRGETADDHKYTKREWKNGRWQYWYDSTGAGKPKNSIKNTLNSVTNAAKKKQQNLKSTINAKQESVKNTINSKKVETKENIKKSVNESVDKAIGKANEASKHVNGLVGKGKDIINKLYNDPNNMYDVTKESYDQKMAQIRDSQEWKDIVARGDSEYVRKNADGTTTYLLDDYVVDKKHPLLDMIGDVAAGREVKINEITKESTVAGLKEHAFGYIRTGMMVAGVAATVLTEKFKLSQGSYDDDIARLTKSVTDGADYTKAILEDTKTVMNEGKDVADRVKTVADSSADIAKNGSNVSPESIEKMAKAIHEGQIAAEAARSVNDGNVIKAAQIIMESDMLRNVMGDNEYYQLMSTTVSNLTPEEVAALNLMIKQMQKNK